MKIITLDIETVSDWQPPGTTCEGCGMIDVDFAKFPPIATHRPVVVSWLKCDTSARTQKIVTHDNVSFGWDSPEVMSLEILAKDIKWAERLVTWNGRSFDMPVLKLRAMACGVDWRFWCSSARGFESTRRSRFANWKDPSIWPFHLDLMDEFGDFAARPGLDDTAKALGLEGKTDVSGGDVGKLWAAGEVDKVREYCEQDVRTTWEIYVKWAVSNGAPAERFEVKG